MIAMLARGFQIGSAIARAVAESRPEPRLADHDAVRTIVVAALELCGTVEQHAGQVPSDVEDAATRFRFRVADWVDLS